MPYRKAVRGAQRFNKRYSKHLSTAQRALNVATAVSKLVNVESKSLVTLLTAAPASTGHVVNLTPIAQGDDFDDRQGRKIRLQSLRIRGEAHINAGTLNSIRIMIVRDNNGSTTQPAITDLYTSVTLFHQNMNKLGDPQSNSRFSVLWDKYIMLANDNREMSNFDKYIKLDSHVFFTGTAATDEGKGHIYAFIASNTGSNFPVLNADAMVKWIDN